MFKRSYKQNAWLDLAWKMLQCNCGSYNNAKFGAVVTELFKEVSEAIVHRIVDHVLNVIQTKQKQALTAFFVSSALLEQRL